MEGPTTAPRETSSSSTGNDYVRLFPWLMVGAAAAAGYFIIPSRRRAAPAAQIEHIHGAPIRPGVVAAPVMKEPVPRRTFFGSMMQFGKNAIWRRRPSISVNSWASCSCLRTSHSKIRSKGWKKSMRYGRGHYVNPAQARDGESEARRQ